LVNFVRGTVPDRPEDVPLYLQEVTRRLEEVLNFEPIIVTVENASMVNSWVNFDTTREARYWLDQEGVVHLSGMLSTGTVGLTAFTLPVGYRPDFVDATNDRLNFAVSSNSAFGVLQVLNTGAVIPAVGSNVFFALDGITFKAA